MHSIRQVVITGLGAVSPLGRGVTALWQGLCAGKCGLAPITLFDVKGLRSTLGGQVDGYEPGGEEPRAVRMLLDAVAEAVENAGFSRDTAPGNRGAVVLGTNFGGMSAAERALKKGAEAFDLTRYGFRHAADAVCEHTGFSGPRTVVSTACASGAATLVVALDFIRSGRADVVIAAGYDELSLYALVGLSALHATGTELVRPFDVNRKGTIFSEGAAALIVEESGHAEERKADPLVRLAGGFMNNDAYHMTAPEKEGKGIIRLIQGTLKDAAVHPDEITHINTHGTGTKYNDLIETKAIRAVFGEKADRIPVTANKSQLGHTMGAAGSFEAISSILTIRDGLVPPTINLEHQDPDCNLDVVTGGPREGKYETVLSNSYGIGGTNAAVVFKARK